MATTAYPHGNVLTANLSFSKPNLNRPSEALGLQGLLFATIGTAFGLLAGTATAVGAWSMNAPVTAENSAAVSISVPGSASSVAEMAVSAPVQTTQEISVSPFSATSPVQHVVANSFTKKVLRSAHKAAFTASAEASPIETAAAETAVASPSATADNTLNSAQMTIEGDLTVTDFDASTGTLATREGRNFTVSPAGSGPSSQDWQDYAGNVHYQCTQTGSCSLTGSGVASSATMI